MLTAYIYIGGRVAQSKWSKWWASAHVLEVDQKDPRSSLPHAKHVWDAFWGVMANYEHCVNNKMSRRHPLTDARHLSSTPS